MAVTVNGSVLTASVTAAAQPRTFSFASSSFTAGDLIVVIANANAPTVFPTINAPTGGTGLSWTSIINQQNTASHFTRSAAFWSAIPSDQTSTISVQISDTGSNVVSGAGALYRLSGAHQTVPVGQTDGFQGQTDPTGTDLQLSGTASGSLILVGGSDWSAGTATLTLSITNATGVTTDQSNLESGEFRSVAGHGSQSGSMNQGTLDYSAATGDWAAIIFEIVAAAGGVTSGPVMFPGMVSIPASVARFAGRTGAAHSR